MNSFHNSEFAIFFMPPELENIALLERAESSDTSLLFSDFYQFLHKVINKKIAQKIARSWSCDRDWIADGFSNWDRDRDRDLNF